MSEQLVDLAVESQVNDQTPVENQENPQPEQVDETKDNTEQKPEDADKKPEEEKPVKDRFQKRVDKLTREKYELKGRVDTLEKMLMNMQQNQGYQQPVDDKPRRDQYQSDDDYIEAMADYKASKKVDERLSQFEQRLNQSRQTEPEQSFEDKLSKATTEYADFDDVYDDLQNAGIQVPKEVNLAIVNSPYTADILYELGKNTSEAKKLSRMNPFDGAVYIGELVAQIKARKGVSGKAKAPITKAPDPIKPVNSTGGVRQKRDHLEHPEDYTPEEWSKLERERVAKLKKR